MNRKEIKDFLETLHFHGYIAHDITKLENLIDDYYPKQLPQADVISTVCPSCLKSDETEPLGNTHRCCRCNNEWNLQTCL